ncbi:host cell division inhibitor Icd-like protein [Erwinia tracheiphila]|uniref:Host cell division inhibitor Icd-like protein n=2 Tax=Erwinia tracheiphila TaxID=65700 RepID=A0A345CY27_9GAMM|nr:host cell division inhibitor Icd-like protein [Erwinia tracheiphila]
MTYAKNNRKYRLTTAPDGLQNPDVAPQWATGRGNPCMLSATTDAPCVFFYVAINATERQIMAWCVHSGHVSAGHEQVTHHSTMSMVAQAGQLSGWPVSDNAGISTPVWAIAICERGNSGDSIDYVVIGGCLMATTPIHSHPQFVWLFLAVRRSDLSAKPHRAEVTAPDFMSARRTIARDFVASFAGRLPVREVAHV